MKNKSLMELSYSEFVDLVNFLKGDDTKSYPVLIRISRFIVGLSTEAAILLGNIIEKVLLSIDCSQEYENFQNNYPSLTIDPSGKATPVKIDFAQIILMTINMSYEMALKAVNEPGKKRDSQQIIYAKTLEPLKKVEPYKNYIGMKALYFKSSQAIINKDDYNELEKELKELTGTNLVANKFLAYIYNRKASTTKRFVDHFSIRVHAAYRNKEDAYLNLLKEISI